MGGGKSFGSKPSYQRNTTKPQGPERDARDAGQRQGQAQPGTPAPGRPWGGIGGMLGGFLVGGLIGSMLFGGMRGFGGPGLLDILIIGGGLFLLFRFLRARREAAQPSSAMAFDAVTTDRLQPDSSGFPMPQPPQTAPLPAGFDEAEFMKGAKAVYQRLQDSWNRRDLEDIRQFTSPEVWEEIRRQAEEDLTRGNTEVLMTNARLLEVRSVDGDTVASVYFDVLMREDPEQRQSGQAREVWHFSRKESVPGSFWILEGIQQVE